MSRYARLTPRLLSSQEPQVTLSFDELDSIVAGGLPDSAKKYGAWWANNASSQPHAKFWLDAGRRASPDFKGKRTVFTLDASVDTSDLAAAVVDESTPQDLTEYVESSLSLERDLEDQIVSHLDLLEPGLTLVSRQESSEVGRLDLLARDTEGRTVIIELKAGEAKDSSIGQIARYVGWYAQKEGKAPRAVLVASGFSEPLRYAAKAIPGLRLVTYRVQFTFEDANV
ncbi:endonuclease NucS domain-containing protein [Variovorax saccharolyticus]|uniref:endonuclease NucS domain-containing protein n=1 Tax=Variovorax saccharolyticus TaxID=3053516 RepID=UPI002578ECBF|nr:endonuclease NucS domain-containing protein [Variovorax sp. J22R187]MDM0021116.1 endonuclease NucS [Variovorax sp. J22R187]